MEKFQRSLDSVIKAQQELNTHIQELQKAFIELQKVQTETPPVQEEHELSCLDSFKLNDYQKDLSNFLEKVYDFKGHETVFRTLKITKYPRYLCTEDCKPAVVKTLFMYGFLDKVITDHTQESIAQLPSVIHRSMDIIFESFGKGLYGLQFHEASSDGVGKPIYVCQIFRVGKNLEGVSGPFKSEIPCTSENVQDWIEEKRSSGLFAIIKQLELALKSEKLSVITHTRQGPVSKAMMDEQSVIQGMLDRLKNLKHNHTPGTIKKFRDKNGPKKFVGTIIEDQSSSKPHTTEEASSYRIPLEKRRYCNNVDSGE